MWGAAVPLDSEIPVSLRSLGLSLRSSADVRRASANARGAQSQNVLQLSARPEIGRSSVWPTPGSGAGAKHLD